MDSTKHSHRKLRCGAPFPGSGNRGESSSISGGNDMICSMEQRGRSVKHLGPGAYMR